MAGLLVAPGMLVSRRRIFFRDRELSGIFGKCPERLPRILDVVRLGVAEQLFRDPLSERTLRDGGRIPLAEASPT
jgi:hypothetical protein